MRASLIQNIVIAAVLACCATADFHLMVSDGPNVPVRYFTCPSNYFERKCYCDGDRRSETGFVGKASNGEWKVKLEKVCGVAEIDFWYRPKGAGGDNRIRWEGYIPNADGHVVAQCYPNGGKVVSKPACYVGFPQRYNAYDSWVCYSEICGHA
ncbi:increased rDNA silencing protein 4 [Coccidioides immitis RS]|uniref:Increased rDNA silencing protein 4 n=3 Tax=Coccidioides immitis TaxID=5501 RepID=A0A0D8JVK9_COCIM|nr:increased rDNA silencing protein 4 [Coccidioides immitis RS]KJF61347.1 increased rDNA silencing protein 4 [Coccidioides immitis RS]KMP08826.1 hypothetical protein CIRG_08507 [Coccidioides immitis RMSCC 2394]KMU87958.1 hypothetical protein CIHG_05725 [Coccidioides immitis H538.4]TPX20685.1 Increased rDNA silencing protein [Coccidioides immitis]